MPLDNLEAADNFVQVETKLDATIDKVNDIDANITGGTTDQVLKKTDASDYNYEYVNSILPDSGTNNLKVKVVEIGDWDMDADATKSVNHGLTKTTIRAVSALIRGDSDGDRFPLDHMNFSDPTDGNNQGGVGFIGNTQVNLVRLTGGNFDSTSFNSTSYNRGWIYITYEG
jgi:hypothetical protein